MTARTKRTTGRRLAGVGATMLLGVAILGTAQTTAEANNAMPAKPHNVRVMHAPCGASASDKDSGAWDATGGGANMRTGSSTSCAIAGTADSGHHLDYHCFTIGDDRQTWTYLRDDSKSPDVYGWVRDDLLSDGGSAYQC